MAENEREDCPFSAETVANSSLVAQYRGYFSEGYARLKEEIAEFLKLLERQHGVDARATFLGSVRIAQERGQFLALRESEPPQQRQFFFSYVRQSAHDDQTDESSYLGDCPFPESDEKERGSRGW